MSFKSFKEKVLDISIKAKNGIVNGTNKAVSFSSKGTVIKDRQILGKIIEKSKNTKFIDKKTQEEKITKKRVIIVFMNEKSEFFKRTLSSYPILAVRTFYQSVIMRLAISDIKDIDLKQYGIERFPSLVVFENTKPIKVIYGEKNIEKVMKSLNVEDLDKVDAEKKVPEVKKGVQKKIKESSKVETKEIKTKKLKEKKISKSTTPKVKKTNIKKKIKENL